MNNIAWAREIMQERHGYTNVTDVEACLWEDIGDHLFYKVIDFGFRVAYWTTKHKELDTTTPEYLNYFKQSRAIAVENALHLACDGRKSYIELGILSDKEIVENCKKQLNLEQLAKNKPKMLKAAN